MRSPIPTIPYKPEEALKTDDPKLKLKIAHKLLEEPTEAILYDMTLELYQKDIALAMQLFLQVPESTKSTDKDKSTAYNNLVVLLLYGYGTAINAANDEKAYYYLSKAIEFDIHPQSKFNLACMLWFGWHLPKEKIEAKRMFTELGNELEIFLNSITKQRFFTDSSRRDMLSGARYDILSSNFPRTPFDGHYFQFPETWGSAGLG